MIHAGFSGFATEDKKEGNILFNDALNTFYFTVIWRKTIQIAKEETRCRHMGYYFRLAPRVLLYTPSHRQDNTYHGLCYTSRGALAGTRLFVLCFSASNTLPENLMQVTTTVLTRSECQSAMGSVSVNIQNMHICVMTAAKDGGSCNVCFCLFVCLFVCCCCCCCSTSSSLSSSSSFCAGVSLNNHSINLLLLLLLLLLVYN